MNKTFLFLLLFSSSIALAGDFTFKLDVALVDHQSPVGAALSVTHNGEVVHTEELAEDGDVKLKLTEGKLYEVWLSKEGYITHVIHNVHDEGSRKMDVLLYHGASLSPPVENYAGVNRSFDKVKDMTIPEELLGDSVAVVNERDMSKEQESNLKDIQSTAKDQRKAQKKIDKLQKKLGKVEEDMTDLDEDLTEEGADRTKLEKKKLKLQEDIVKINKKLDRLDY